jgi:hypothetical protein
MVKAFSKWGAQDSAIAESGLTFWECPPPMGKAQGKIYDELTYVDHKVYEWEGSYTYK